MTLNRETIDAILAMERCPVVVRRDGQNTLCGYPSDTNSAVALCPRHAQRAGRDLPSALKARLEQFEESVEASRLRDDQEMSEAIVYYLQRADGLVKIGFSRQFPTRLASLTREHGPLLLLAAHTGGRPAERHWHRRFADDRVEGEWFHLSDALADHIKRVGVPDGIPTRPLSTWVAA